MKYENPDFQIDNVLVSTVLHYTFDSFDLGSDL